MTERATLTGTGLIPAPPDEQLRQDEVLFKANLAGLVICVFYLVLYEASGAPLRWLLGGVAWYALTTWLSLTGRFDSGWREASRAVTLVGSVVLQWLAGGLLASGMNALWGIFALFGTAVLGSRWRMSRWIFVYILTLGVEIGMELLLRPPAPARPAWFPIVIGFLNLALLSGLSSAILAQVNRERLSASRALAAEHQRSEHLLLNILPAEIAERLKKHEEGIAERLDEVTVMFADLVGFTELSSRVSPTVLVETLDRLFGDFDEIAERLGLEKIKTIGDAYMAVAGAPRSRSDHAQVVGQAAIEMLEVVDRLPPGAGGALALRIGIESGPVVAGVIGRRKFSYDLWGSTVNMASRMESTGIPGSIQVGPGTYEKLRNEYLFDTREAVPVKGMGTLKTYVLRGRRDGL